MEGNPPLVNSEALTCLTHPKKAFANKWLNESTEVVRDIKHHHTEHRSSCACSRLLLSTSAIKKSEWSICHCYHAQLSGSVNTTSVLSFAGNKFRHLWKSILKSEMWLNSMKSSDFLSWKSSFLSLRPLWCKETTNHVGWEVNPILSVSIPFGVTEIQNWPTAKNKVNIVLIYS